MFAFQNVLSLSSLVAANDCHKKKTGVLVIKRGSRIVMMFYRRLRHYFPSKPCIVQ